MIFVRRKILTLQHVMLHGVDDAPPHC